VIQNRYEKLNKSDFLTSFGADPSEEIFFVDEASKYDFSWRRLERDERDAAILSILQKIDGFTKVGEHRSGVWSDSWERVRKQYILSGCKIEALDPPFMGSTPIIRLNGDYAIPKDPAFEHHWFRVYRNWLFKKFLNDEKINKVFEFGCGSGFNLVRIAQLYPHKDLIGLDWALPAVDLVNQVAKDHNLNLTGRHFDYFSIDETIPIDTHSVVCTFCSLEQTGKRFVPFLEWLIKKKPKLVISMEPAIENYNQDNLYDYLAWRYVEHREYLKGYFLFLRAASAAGKIEILHDHRPQFGSFFHEGYSTIVWRSTQ